MTKAHFWPVLGVAVAIAVTTTMDTNGLSAMSALPLFPLMALFWFLQRLPRRSVGFTWGRPACPESSSTPTPAP